MARRGRRSSSISENNKTRPSIVATGGSWSPLPISSIEFIEQAAFDILTTIGVSDAPKILISKIEKEGGICKKGRLLYPVGLLLDTIKNSPKRVLLAGQLKKNDMWISNSKTFTGTGGASPSLFDPNTQSYKH